MDMRVRDSSFGLGVLFGMLAGALVWGTALGGARRGILNDLLLFPGADKVGHLVVYGGLTAVAVFGIGDRRLGRVPIWPALFLAVSTFDEIRQSTIPGRDVSLADITANITGIALGWLLARSARRPRSNESADSRDAPTPRRPGQSSRAPQPSPQTRSSPSPGKTSSPRRIAAVTSPRLHR